MSTLGQYLAGQGFAVDDNPVAGRDSTWKGVSYLMVHHFVGSEDPAKAASEAQYAKTGGSYPPICQLYLDVTGKVWVIAQERSGQKVPGRASHAGEGSGYGMPKDQGNEVSLGIECQNNGNHPIGDNPVQYQALINLLAALCRYYGLAASQVVGHKEYAPDRKVDPRDDMNVMRSNVAAALGGTVPPPTTPPPTTPPPPSGFKPVYRQGKKVYSSKMKYGQANSDSVWNLQNGLMAKGYSIPDGPTDYYGSQTQAATAQCQRDQGFTGSDADGIAGKTTIGYLGLVWVQG